MTSVSVLQTTSIQDQVESIANGLLASLPEPEQLSSDQRRGIIARYAAVLEGNFIYWMTGAYISAASEEARAIIMENLLEEVRDSHPNMMRKFAVAANAVPTDTDADAVYSDLTEVRLFVGRLSGVQILVMMAFFEGFIQRFMAFLAELAERQGSTEMEYTDVHGVCDVVHTQELFRALAAEMQLNPMAAEGDVFEGANLLRTLIERIVDTGSGVTSAARVN